MSNKLPVEEHYKKYLKLYRELYPDDYYLEDDDIIQEIDIKMYKNKQQGNPQTLHIKNHLDMVHNRYKNNYIDRCESFENLYNEPYLDSFKGLYDELIKDGISHTIKTLTRREQLVIELVYGLDGGGQKSCQNVCDILKDEYYIDYSSEGVRRIKLKAERKLRHPARIAMLKKRGVEYV